MRCTTTTAWPRAARDRRSAGRLRRRRVGRRRRRRRRPHVHRSTPGAWCSAPLRRRASSTSRPPAPAEATVTTTSASTLLPIGTTPVLAEHPESHCLDCACVCISGFGETMNVVTHVNPGVIAESAAVLLDSGWSATDPGPWSAAAASGGAWIGWENCGVKPEGLPSRRRASFPRRRAATSRTSSTAIPERPSRSSAASVARGDVAAMLSPAGLLALDDLERPLQLTLRAYADGAGHGCSSRAASRPSAWPLRRGASSLFTCPVLERRAGDQPSRSSERYRRGRHDDHQDDELIQSAGAARAAAALRRSGSPGRKPAR